jgi:hypothetical protein
VVSKEDDWQQARFDDPLPLVVQVAALLLAVLY